MKDEIHRRDLADASNPSDEVTALAENKVVRAACGKLGNYQDVRGPNQEVPGDRALCRRPQCFPRRALTLR
jgi:hypothetical protein